MKGAEGLLLWAPVVAIGALAFLGIGEPTAAGVAVFALGVVALVPLVGWLRVLSFLPLAAAGTGAAAAAFVLGADQAVPLAFVAATVAGVVTGAAVMAAAPRDAAGGVLVSLFAAVAAWGLLLPVVSVAPASEVVLLGVDLSSDRALGITATGLLAAAVWGLSHLSRSRVAWGALLAAADPESAVRTGVHTRTVRLQIGMVSGAVGAWAGLVLTLDAQTLPAASVLAPGIGVAWLAAALVGGRFWLPGVLTAALLVGGLAPVAGLPVPAAAGVALAVLVVSRAERLVGLWGPGGGTA